MGKTPATSNLNIAERLFSPEMMIWKVDREVVLMLAGGRALLMQLAHPKVAAGVADHSHFREDPLGRLHRTMATMWSIVFDEPAAARAALDQVRKVHERVRGVVRPAEPVAAGSPYDAFDPELLLWVHATLIDSALLAYDLFVQPLTPEEKSRYYDDTKQLAHLFDIPEAVLPSSLGQFDDYMGRMLKEGEITVGPTAKSLAREILYPRPWVLRPAGPLFRLITAGLLPQPLREGYGLGWSGGREKKFRLLVRGIKGFLLFLPQTLRIVPNARHAEKQIKIELFK